MLVMNTLVRIKRFAVSQLENYFQNLYPTVTIIRVIRLMIMICVRRELRKQEMRYAHKILVRNPEWKKPLGNPDVDLRSSQPAKSYRLNFDNGILTTSAFSIC
jgi:hypothetical protein